MNFSKLASVVALLPHSGTAAKLMQLCFSVSEDYREAKGLMQEIIDSHSVEIHTVIDPITGEEVVKFFTGDVKKKIETSPRIQLPTETINERQAAALTFLNSVGFTIHEPTFAFVKANIDKFAKANSDGYLINTAKRVVGLVEEFWASGHKVGYQTYHMSDLRRAYSTGSALSHQGDDVHRGLMDLVTPQSMEIGSWNTYFGYLQDNFGINKHNYETVLADPTILFDKAKAIKMGLTGKKPVGTYRAAYSLKELYETGKTGYIYQQDASCDGAQRIGKNTGCMTLCTLTNLCGGEVRDVYSAVSDIAWFIKGASNKIDPRFYTANGNVEARATTAKPQAMTGLYGSGTTSRARQLILADPQNDPIVYLDQYNRYIPGTLDKIRPERLNKHHRVYWLEMASEFGWQRVLDTARLVAESYTLALYNLSPRLMDFMTTMKKMNKIAVKRGEYLTATLDSYVYKNCAWVSNTDEKVVRVTLRDGKGGRFQFSTYPYIQAATDSAAAPTETHWEDGIQVIEMALKCAARNIPYYPIFDSHGTGVGYIQYMNRMWKDVFYRMFLDRKESVYFEMMRRYGITPVPSLYKNGWDGETIAKGLAEAHSHIG